MNRKGITRGDAIVILAIVLIFIFSFFKYYEVSAAFDRSSGSDDSDNPFGSDRSRTKGWNAWTVNFYPLMPAVVLVPLLAALLLVIGRFVAQPDRQVLGLAPRQWAIAFSVTGAISGFFAPFGVGGVIGEIFEDSDSVDAGPTVFAWLMMVAGLIAALFLIIGDRIPSLAAPLFSPVPQQPWGYPPPNGTGGYPVPVDPSTGYPLPNATGAYPPPAYPVPGAGTGTGAPMAGVPAHMPPPDVTGAGAGTGSGAAPVAGGQPAPATQEFAQYWFAVPEARPLAPTEGLSKEPVATLQTGQWYLAVAPHPGGVLVEVDGVRGVLSDVSGIQRGE
ncbi:hypothetical protein [Embleya scabrispora]|uniref:hypothetical protein n=1 Tax=Embleya scabrispora TaxID=159449 RepID=UPI00036AE9F3|nr:hypothetical protein [Embleya scabrispora]MYS85718.1 hypothetical protein [Streptomyces sp. SID5474]